MRPTPLRSLTTVPLHTRLQAHLKASPVLPHLTDVLRSMDFVHFPAGDLNLKALTMQQLLQAAAKHTNSRPEGSGPDPTTGNLLGCIAGFGVIMHRSKLSWLQRITRVKGLRPFFRRWMADVAEAGSGELEDVGDLLNLVVYLHDGGVMKLGLEDVEGMRLAELAVQAPLELGDSQWWQADMHTQLAKSVLRVAGGAGAAWLWRAPMELRWRTSCR